MIQSEISYQIKYFKSVETLKIEIVISRIKKIDLADINLPDLPERTIQCKFFVFGSQLHNNEQLEIKIVQRRELTRKL